MTSPSPPPSDHIASGGYECFAGATAREASAAGERVFSVCLVADYADVNLYAVLGALAEDKAVAEILFSCRSHPEGSSIDRSRIREGGKIRETPLRVTDKDHKPAPRSALPSREKTYNILASLASFPFLLFMDARVRIDPGFASALYEEIRSLDGNPDYGVFFPACVHARPLGFVTPDRFLLHEGLGFSPGGLPFRLLSGKKSAYAQELAAGRFVPVRCFAVTRFFFWYLNGFDPELKRQTVQEFCIHAVAAGGRSLVSERVKCAYLPSYDDFCERVEPEDVPDLARIFDKHFDGMYKSGVVKAGLFLFRVKAFFRSLGRFFKGVAGKRA
jgi:hypothetical protein